MHYRASVTTSDSVLQVRGKIEGGKGKGEVGMPQKALWIEDCTGRLEVYHVHHDK